MVDWSDLAGNRMYPVPARQTRDVGRNIAAFIDHLVVEERVADISQFHLIGISLGGKERLGIFGHIATDKM